MSILGRLVEWLHDLPPAETREVVIERDLEVPMPDGAVLLADHWAPRGGGKRPTILIRTPYGRARLFGILFGRPLAERGFQVLLQSCRGTFGSGGAFDPFRNERADGLATFAWMKRQPWFSGEAATFGVSYLGMVQWAIATEAGPELKAMSAQLTASDVRDAIYNGESFWLDTALTWIHLVHDQEQSLLLSLLGPVRAARALRHVYGHLPLRSADEAAVGEPVPFFRDWLEHDAPGDPWWKPVDYSGEVAAVTAPVHLTGGWYDVFLPQTIADHARLQEAGRRPYLTIGPWAHTSFGSVPVILRESIAWFRAHLSNDCSLLREAPVRVFVMGANAWRDYPAWPPAGHPERRWHLHSGGRLALDAPVASDPDRYRYDPADPTPAVGGSSLSRNSGPKDNRALEARPDVLVYSSAPLDEDTEVIGPVRAELHVASSLEHTDFFVRLCDVDPSGRSINVCDGLLRLSPGRPAKEPDGTSRIRVDLWPTAYRFRRRHRVRVQVSSGAHPRFARNLGSGEPLATATTMNVADQRVYHDPTHPSAILLPTRA